MKTRFVVSCLKHGVESKDWAGRQVVVPRPENKKQQFTDGCPHCKREAQAEAAAKLGVVLDEAGVSYAGPNV